MGKTNGKDQGTPIVLTNEAGEDIMALDHGVEIQRVKDYGVGLDVLSAS